MWKIKIKNLHNFLNLKKFHPLFSCVVLLFFSSLWSPKMSVMSVYLFIFWCCFVFSFILKLKSLSYHTPCAVSPPSTPPHHPRLSSNLAQIHPPDVTCVETLMQTYAVPVLAISASMIHVSLHTWFHGPGSLAVLHPLWFLHFFILFFHRILWSLRKWIWWRPPT